MSAIRKTCESISNLKPGRLSVILSSVESHRWVLKSADKSPYGMTSRFVCKKCGDEFVAMLTSPRTFEENSPATSGLEVLVADITMK